MFTIQYKKFVTLGGLIVMILMMCYVIVPQMVFVEEQLPNYIYREPTISERLKEMLPCRDSELVFEKVQYGDYWLLRNLIIGSISRNVSCAETITYTTNGDFTFFDSLPIIIKSWLAPISFALFAPGFDIKRTMESIQYSLNCLPESDLIQKYVTFHIYFPNNHMPAIIPRTQQEALDWKYNCNASAPYLNVERSTLYKTIANLTYPINVGRNIARKAVNTHFIFPCDIELIPSPNLIPKFLKMVANNIEILHENNKYRVFPIPVFEVKSDAAIPQTKTELKAMLGKRKAVVFHSYVCKTCHLVPNYTNWLDMNDTDDLDISGIGKRKDKFKYWEPFYISDNREPYFDERVTWEGQSNKRIQNFAMCLLNYDYLVLHPAFLVHMPGIKYLKKNTTRHLYVQPMNLLIKRKIEPEYKILYGKNPACRTWRAPVSVALFAPRWDFIKTMTSIQYVRNCLPESRLIRQYVTFHIYFPVDHKPSTLPENEKDIHSWAYSCDNVAPYANVDRSTMYRSMMDLTYPINVARNIARKAANTYFIFPCDIELIPSPKLVPKFLAMIAHNIQLLKWNNGKRVFPVPIFELQTDADIPHTKHALRKLLKNGMATEFHVDSCVTCHLVPQQEDWLAAPDSALMSVSAIGKRQGNFSIWEPFYISDNREPDFDERLTWEGQSDKRIQNFAMCLLGYDYLILHPAFLIHLSRNNDHKNHTQRWLHVQITKERILTEVEPEYRRVYGENFECEV